LKRKITGLKVIFWKMILRKEVLLPIEISFLNLNIRSSYHHCFRRIGANHELVRKNWPERLGKPPENMVCGVPAYVDGKMMVLLKMQELILLIATECGIIQKVYKTGIPSGLIMG
jgi:hypothetical protein